MGRFTRISTDAFDALQVDAGVVLTNFDPANPYQTPQSEDILATTSGGVNPVYSPEWTDFAEDVDNVPNNMMEFKRLTNQTATLSFTSIKFNADNTKWALGAADTELMDNGVTIIKPRRDVLLTDFKDLWWVGDKANGGAYAIKLLNALSTGGLSIQSTKNGKGTNAVTVTGHVSINAQDIMPMQIYDIPPQSAETIVGVAPEAGSTVLFDTPVSDMQSNVVVTDNAITGTLKYIEDGLAQSGPLAGSGNFLALKFAADNWNKFTSVKVGLDPSVDTGLVEIINDPDKNGVFKISGEIGGVPQVFKVVTTVDGVTNTQTFSLSGLILEGGV